MNSVPKQFTSLADLLFYLDIKWPEARQIYCWSKYMYKSIFIPKKPSGTRHLLVPDQRLKYIQRKVLKILQEVYKPRNTVHGFVKSRDIKSNASVHIARPFILNIDLKDFFGSITPKRIRGLFKSLGFEANVCDFLTKICSVHNQLPQGAPTSPVLANMISMRMDGELRKLCKPHRIRYTRYADDMSFSAYLPPSALLASKEISPGKLSIEQLSPRLVKILRTNGFHANSDKVIYSDRNMRLEVTGLVVNQVVNVPRRFVRNIRSALYKIETTGYGAAQAEWATKFNGTTSLSQTIKGRIEWVGYIRGRSNSVFRKLALAYNAQFSGNQITVEPSLSEQKNLSIWIVELGSATSKHYKQGTAFFLKGTGLVTAYHCVDKPEAIAIFHPSDVSKKFSVKVDKTAPHHDLATLSHSVPTSEYYELLPQSSDSVIGEYVEVLGYPSYGPGKGMSTRSGKITSTRFESAVKKIEVDCEISDGISGAPLLNQFGTVIGVGHKGGQDSATGDVVDNLAIHIVETKHLK